MLMSTLGQAQVMTFTGCWVLLLSQVACITHIPLHDHLPMMNLGYMDNRTPAGSPTLILDFKMRQGQFTPLMYLSSTLFTLLHIR